MRHITTSKKSTRYSTMMFCFVLMVIIASKTNAQEIDTLLPSQTWTVPNGVTSATIYLWGGGGAGAGFNSANCRTNGGGGGGGACVSAVINGLVPGQVYTFTGGAGGIGNAVTGSPG